MSNKHDWTEQLPEAFEGFTEAEPEGLWDAVQGSLTPQKKRIAAAWWWSAAGLAAAACVALGVFLFRDDSPVIPGDNLAVIPSEVSAVIPSEVEGSAASSLRAEAPESPGLPTTAAPSHGRSLQTAGLSGTSATPASGSSAVISSEGEKSDTIKENQNTDTVIERTESESHTDTKDSNPSEIIIEPKLIQDQQKVRKPTEFCVKYGVASGGLLAMGSSRTTSGYGLPTALPGMPMTKAAGVGNGLSPVMLSRNKPSTTTATHRQSARFGLTVTGTFNDRWGLESGLMLTTLTSSYASETATASSTTDRSMTYLGIPLYAHYRIWGWRRINFYAIGGPMFEWSVSTRTETVTGLGTSRTQDISHDNIRDHRWSLGAAAGLQLNLFRNTYIYAQPGLSWHIPNHSDLENAYTEHPLSPDVTFGLRIHFE